MIRVNDVIIISIDGASEITVRIRSICNVDDNEPPEDELKIKEVVIITVCRGHY